MICRPVAPRWQLVGRRQALRMDACLLLVLLLAVTSATANLRPHSAAGPAAEAAAAVALLPPTLSVTDKATFQASEKVFDRIP